MNFLSFFDDNKIPVIKERTVLNSSFLEPSSVSVRLFYSFKIFFFFFLATLSTIKPHLFKPFTQNRINNLALI